MNTLEAAERCLTEWDFSSVIFPRFGEATDQEAYETLYRLTLEGCSRRYGEITLAVDVRDDDPKLLVRMEAASDVSFQSIQTGTVTSSDPAPGDGLKRLHFKDPVLQSEVDGQRFWRLKLELTQ
jgi:hypothetical protein